MAIPYIDLNPKGSGYYSYAERKAEISIFMFGFLGMWIILIIIGTFLRGPNWNFFGPFQYWDSHLLPALTNVNLSEYVWVKWLEQGLPESVDRPLDQDYVEAIVPLIHDRLKKLSEATELTSFFFEQQPRYNPLNVIQKGMLRDDTRVALGEIVVA